MIGGHEWTYAAAGQGECLLFLHGGMSSARMYAGYVEELSTSFRVLAPEQGGYIALEIAELFPTRVRSLLLSSTGMPSEQHAREVSKQSWKARLVPNFLFGLAFRVALPRKEVSN